MNKLITKDKLKKRFIVKDVDHIWTMDFTKIMSNESYNIWLFTIMDVTTRRILFHTIKNDPSLQICPFNTREVLRILEECFSFCGNKPKIIHTDCGGQFVSTEFNEFLHHHQIEGSLGDQVIYKHSNQVHERFHRTIKDIIKQKLTEKIGTKQNRTQLKDLGQLKDINNIITHINHCIDVYNNKEHSSLWTASPNIIEHALLLKGDQDTGALFRNHTKGGDEINLYKKEVLVKYAGNWQQFFIDWRLEHKKQHEATIAKIEQEKEVIVQEVKEQAELTISALSGENQQLHQKIKEMQHNIEQMQQLFEELSKREEYKIAQEKEQEERRLARRNRSRRPLRDAATVPELEKALDLVEQKSHSPFVKARDKASLLFLYLFGLRVSNLRLIQVKHVLQLLNNDFVQLPLIKSKTTNQMTYPISPLTKELLKKYQHILLFLIQNKEEDQYVITPEDSTDPLSRVNLTNNLNTILKETGKNFYKKLTSHSFRIGFTTSIIEVSGIETAQKLVGHSSIMTTSVYSRRHLNTDEIKRILNNVERSRQKYTRKKYNVKKRDEPKGN